jgi:DNA-binding GntR family transcriptional regulator
MQALAVQPSLVQRVCEAIITDIVAGRLPSGGRLIQDEIARALGVSRQPVQQALLLLRNQGLVKEASGRGLVVAPLERQAVRDLYQLRGAMEALAVRLAATQRQALGEAAARLAQGRTAIREGGVENQIAADIAFHTALAKASGNALLSETMAPHWPKFRRIMAEVLREGEQATRRVWDEHEAILEATRAGDADLAEALCREHLAKASSLVEHRISAESETSGAEHALA